MTAPEGVNLYSTVDATIGSTGPENNQNLQMVVERAEDELRQLTLQRQEITQKIAIIKRTIAGLALLYGAELQRSSQDKTAARRKRGITNACRVVLSRADTPLSARGVYAVLQGEFPDLVRQPGNHYASLVTILNRLVNYGEADTFLRDGNRFWQRHQSADHGSVGLSGNWNRE